jgi:hypothetical protein
MDGAQSGYLSHLLIRLSAEVRHRLPEIAGSRRPPQCGRARDVTHTSTGRAQTSTARTFPSERRLRRRTSIRARDVAFPPFWRIRLCRRSVWLWGSPMASRAPSQGDPATVPKGRPSFDDNRPAAVQPGGPAVPPPGALRPLARALLAAGQAARADRLAFPVGLRSPRRSTAPPEEPRCDA